LDISYQDKIGRTHEKIGRLSFFACIEVFLDEMNPSKLIPKFFILIAQNDDAWVARHKGYA
jgi:hypothetical protein